MATKRFSKLAHLKNEMSWRVRMSLCVVCVWKILIEWHFIYTHGSESLPHFFDCSGEIFSFKYFTANDQNPHTKLSFLHYSNKLFILLLSEIIVAVYWFCGESNFSSQDDEAKIWEDGHLFYDILFDTSFCS